MRSVHLVDVAMVSLGSQSGSSLSLALDELTGFGLSIVHKSASSCVIHQILISHRVVTRVCGANNTARCRHCSKVDNVLLTLRGELLLWLILTRGEHSSLDIGLT